MKLIYKIYVATDKGEIRFSNCDEIDHENVIPHFKSIKEHIDQLKEEKNECSM